MNTNTDKNMTTSTKKFNAGDINYACGANQLSAEDKQYFINEHLNGCWGDVSKYQAAINNAAVQAQKGTIISVHYNDATGEQIKIYTELEAGNTNVLLIGLNGTIC